MFNANDIAASELFNADLVEWRTALEGLLGLDLSSAGLSELASAGRGYLAHLSASPAARAGGPLADDLGFLRNVLLMMTGNEEGVVTLH